MEKITTLSPLTKIEIMALCPLLKLDCMQDYNSMSFMWFQD